MLGFMPIFKIHRPRSFNL